MSVVQLRVVGARRRGGQGWVGDRGELGAAVGLVARIDVEASHGVEDGARRLGRGEVEDADADASGLDVAVGAEVAHGDRSGGEAEDDAEARSRHHVGEVEGSFVAVATLERSTARRGGSGARAGRSSGGGEALQEAWRRGRLGGVAVRGQSGVRGKLGAALGLASRRLGRGDGRDDEDGSADGESDKGSGGSCFC